MNNITMEQRKDALNKIISSKDFENTVDKIIENKMSYYNWLKNNIKPKQLLNCEDIDFSFNYALDYVYRCMLMDSKHKTSVVYFIRNKYNGLLKIGKTNDLQRRINEIESCFNFLGLDTNELAVEAISYCPYGMNNGKVETYYHNLFKEKRKIGEWFDVSYDELLNSLFVDYIINGVLVTVEDTYDFPNGVKKLKLAENDYKLLKKEVTNELKEKVSKQLGILNTDIYNIFNRNNNITYSEDLFNYIMSLNSSNDTNLDNKIKKDIENILSFIDYDD